MASSAEARADNAALAELLALAALDQEPGSQRQRAMHRASRAAMWWDVRALDLVAAGIPLTELDRVGPWLAEVIGSMLREGAVPPAPPPLRQGFTARADALAVCRGAPGWHGAVRSDLQMHTLRSDGHASLEAMAERCIALGYSHIAVTDHSEGLRVAHGMDDATRAAQAAEVKALNARFAADGLEFTVLHGIEMNISPEGAGDTTADALAELDIVLGAFHSKLRIVEDQTDRYVRALHNPTVDVLAHPRGRMYDRRLGLTARWHEVFEAAAETGVALEVDAYPDRQDLDVELLARAARAGAWLAVDTDSHHPIDLDVMPIGVAALINAGVPQEQVINTLTTAGLLDWLAARRSRAAERARRDRRLV